MENKNFDWTELDIEQRKKLFTAKDKVTNISLDMHEKLQGNLTHFSACKCFYCSPNKKGKL